MLDVVNNVNVHHEVAIFEKAGNFSVLALTHSKVVGVTVIGRVDGRSPRTQAAQGCLKCGQKGFELAISTSIENGWKIAWRGFPYGRKDG